MLLLFTQVSLTEHAVHTSAVRQNLAARVTSCGPLHDQGFFFSLDFVVVLVVEPSALFGLKANRVFPSEGRGHSPVARVF